MDLLWLNSAGGVLIALIVYWFWFSKPASIKVTSREINIIVDDGIYTPARIEITSGDSVVLNFLRKDPSPCAEKVIFSALNISAELPINKNRRIEIKKPPRGEYEFTCQMQMYRGTLIVT